ncbi:chromate transporter [Oscillibacter valericigenes]|nr:chromate transporter [Oscillibacter valericigenes]
MKLLLQLFFSFFQVGLFSVGGGYAAIPLIQDQIVNVTGLMTLEEFTDLITIAEMTPGPISINSATFVGTRLCGVPGAVICTLGCILAPFIICLTMAHFYYKYRNFSGVQNVLGALRPATVALIGSAGVSILVLALFQSDLAGIQLSNFQGIEFVLFGVCLFLLRKYKMSAITIILGSGVVGTVLYLLKDLILP